MGQATSKGNKAKSKIKHRSDVPMPRFKTQVVVICDPTHYQLDQRGTMYERGLYKCKSSSIMLVTLHYTNQHTISLAHLYVKINTEFGAVFNELNLSTDVKVYRFKL